jgi:hypothetical protein
VAVTCVLCCYYRVIIKTEDVHDLYDNATMAASKAVF